MRKIMKNYNELKHTMESLLSSLKISYEPTEALTWAEPDLSYSIWISPPEKWASAGALEGLLYLRESDFTVNLLVFNICDAKDDNKLDAFYKIVNDANDYIATGNFVVCPDRREIIYHSCAYCGNDFRALSDGLLSFQLKTFRRGLEKLVTELT